MEREIQMITAIRRFAGALAITGALIATGGDVGAQANQDGLVNVAIGDITIQDINIGLAAQVAANACGINVGPVAVLGRAVDRSGGLRTVCTIDQGDVTVSQN
jgi:hypothetical protein